MASGTSPLEVDLITNLKTMRTFEGTVILLVGAVTLTDGLGGLYRWSGSETSAEDTKYWNFIGSNVTSAGRWVRINQRVRVSGAGNLVTNGGFKQFFIGGTTASDGTVTVYLTSDGTATGPAIFTEVWTTTSDVNLSVTSANDSPIGSRLSLSADLKTLKYQFVRGATTTALLNLAIPGLRSAAAGTPVVIQVAGI